MNISAKVVIRVGVVGMSQNKAGPIKWISRTNVKCYLILVYHGAQHRQLLPVPMAEARKENDDVTVIVVCRSSEGES